MTPEEAKGMKVGDVYYHVGVTTYMVREHTLGPEGDKRIEQGRITRMFLSRKDAEEFSTMKRIQEALHQ